MLDVNIGQMVEYYWTIGRQTKRTPSEWIAGNAICCVHNGQTIDKRKRGGLITSDDGSFSYSCFNCGFSTSWKPGRLLSTKNKRFLHWLNVSDDDIKKMSFMALKLTDQSKLQVPAVSVPIFSDHSLPDGTRKLDENTPHNILEYVSARRLEHSLDKLYYTSTKPLKNYLIIPLTYNNRIVGWIGRSVLDKSVNRYYVESEPGYVYGICEQRKQDQFVLVTEGIIDALHIRGISVLGSSVNNPQLNIIRSLNKPIILVPDRDTNGSKMVDMALENEWFVSFPDWDNDIKDVSNSVEKYGRLATFKKIMESVCSSKLKAQLKQRIWFN